MKFFEDKRLIRLSFVKGTNKIMNHGEERLKKTRLAKKSNEQRKRKEFPRRQRETRQLNANTSISPAWCCNCGMISCHVKCVLKHLKMK